MEDDDLGINWESPVKKPDASRRRRSNLFGNGSDTKDGEVSKPPPKPRKNSGWADEGTTGFFRFRRQSTRPPQSTVKIEPPKAPKTETILDRDDESDTEMPVIPDLDEVDKEDLTSEVAQAPSVNTNEIARFQQLDGDLLKHAALAKLDGLDLRILTKYLSLEEDLREPDVAWTWDVLFTEVVSATNREGDICGVKSDK